MAAGAYPHFDDKPDKWLAPHPGRVRQTPARYGIVGGAACIGPPLRMLWRNGRRCLGAGCPDGVPDSGQKGADDECADG